jgi:prepilin-type N-terminal cleavage/methylation domain-containing protein
MHAQKRQRGFTLTEVLVATAIFTIVMLAALLMYDRNNRIFKSGVEASDLQQNTRIGFDKLVSDLRIEGFDYNRNGDPSGSDEASGVNYQRPPDEQIEYMGESAIAFRANFNYNTGAYDNGREGDKRTAGAPTDTYESQAFPLVTIANNEIVIYALQSNSTDANANKSVIDFYADVAKPRLAYHGGNGKDKERHVIINGYDTTNNYPPYTLYRLTLKDADIADAAANPIGAAVPIANNVRSLKFEYYNDQGASSPVAPGIVPVYGAGQYDAANAQAVINERATRAGIQSIRVSLVGMDAAADAGYVSPAETNTAFQHYRQYELTSLVVPRNVGKRAVKEEQLLAPQAATLKTICYGACAVPYFTWQAPKDGNVDFYAIIYDTDSSGSGCSACTFSNGYPVGNVTEAYFPRPLSPGTTYFFRIEASNGYGDSVSAEIGSVKAINTTTPAAPTVISGQGTTTTLTNRVRLTWQTPTAYANNPSLTCVDPAGGSAGTNAVSQTGIAPAEAIAYRVYRAQGSANANFDPDSGQGELIASETNGTQPYVDVAGVATLDDYVPACTDFYYRIQAVAADCANNDAYNYPAQKTVSLSTYYPKVSDTALLGKAISANSPAAPANFKVTRPLSCDAAGTLRGVNIPCDLSITFDKVTQDTGSPAQPVKIDTYTLTRTQLHPSTPATLASVPSGCTYSGSVLTCSIPGQWDSLLYSGSSLAYTDAGVAMTDQYGISYQYQYSLVASTNSCSATSVAVTASKPGCYYSIGTEPVKATTSDGGTGILADPYQLYGGSSTFVFTASSLASITAYVNAGGSTIATFTGVASPFTFTVPTGLNTGQEYSVDFVAKDTSGCYWTETVYFIQQGGVCNYAAAPSAVSTPTQVNSGLTLAKPWSLQPAQTIKWTASDLASAAISVIDTTNGNTVQTFTPTGTTETLTWPTLTYGTTYKIDIVLTSNISCQREDFYYVTQVCAGYSGGTPTFTIGDATHTGLTSASAWQLVTGGTLKLTDSAMKTLKVTATDLTSSTAFATATYTAVTGVATITWPATNVTAVNNHIYQLDLVLVDVNGCTSSTYTRYVTQYCSYSGGTPTITATQTLRLSSDSSGTGLTSTSPFLMLPDVDTISVAEASVKTIYVDYLDATTGNVLAGVTTHTWNGTTPIKFSNPIISSFNNKTYRIDITLADVNGCKSTTKYTRYVKQAACALRPQANASDTAVIAALTNQHGAGSNLSNVITVYNKSNVAITINAITIQFGSLGTGNNIQDAVFTNGTVSSGSSTSPTTINAPTSPTALTVAAGSSTTIVIDYNYTPATTPLTSVCIKYTTNTATPYAEDGLGTSKTVTQSCNVQYSASASVLNPSGCD